MKSSKVVLTYKRKRFSNKAHLEQGIKEDNFSPDSLHAIAESGFYSEKLNKDNGKESQYSISTQRQDSEESSQKQGQEKKRTRRNKSIETSEMGMGPVKLRSQVLLSRELPEGSSKKENPSITDDSVSKIEDSFSMDISCKSSGSACKVFVEEIPRSKSSNLVDSRISPACLNSSTERKYSSDCSDSVLKMLSSDNVLLSKENIKENSSCPLITFRRRVKKKQIISMTPVEKKLKAEDNQFSSVNCSSHALEVNCEPDNSSQKCSFKDQYTSATVPAEQADISTLQILQHDVMVNADNDVIPDSVSAGDLVGVKIAGDKSGVATIYSGGLNSDCEPSNKRMAAPTVDGLKDPILLMHENRQSDLVTGGAREKLGNGIATTVNNKEKFVVSHDISEKCQISDLNVSAALPSSVSPSNGESNKPSVDVMLENLLESQSSNPSCIEVFDDEADGRGKELEWLESLDKALKEAKKDKDTCPLKSSRASPKIPSKSSVQIERNQGAYKEYMNQIRPLQERTLLTGSGEPSYEKQNEETSNRTSPCSNFVGLSFPPSSGVPVGSVKDFQNMRPRSTLGFKEDDNGQLSWHTLDERSYLVRHKQIVEDVITGTKMLTERQGSFLDKYKMYSNEWSEEELDFLWIGVRRHGIYSWSSMLRDSKLHFSESRVAEDLARRWDLEQRKLLNGARIHPASLSRPVISSSAIDSTSLVNPAAAPRYGGYGSWSHAYSEFPMTPAETKLSLGDVYRWKENSLKINPFHFSGLGTTNQFTDSSSSTASFLSSFPIGSTYPNAGLRNQKLARPQNTRYDWESSILCQKSGESSSQEPQHAGIPASGNVPHWLKEVLGTPPGLRESVLPTVSPVAQSVNLLNNDVRVGVPFPNLGDPHKDAQRRGILKRKKSLDSGNKSGALRMSDVPTATNESWTPTRLGTFMPSQKPASGVIDPDKYSSYDLNKKFSGPKGPSDLVVIDSDATSEETISDDQS